MSRHFPRMPGVTRGWVAVAATLVLLGACQRLPLTSTLEVQVVGAGGVTSSPAGVDTDAGRASASFEVGTTVVLEAVPAAGSVFLGFSGAVCLAGDTATQCVVRLDADLTVTATFAGGGTDLDLLEIEALEPTAAAQLTLALDPYTGSVSVEALRDDTTARAAHDGEFLRVAWVGGAALDGPQVRLRFTPPLSSPPRLLDVLVLSQDGGQDLGAVALRTSVVAGDGAETSSLLLDPLEVGELVLDPAWADAPLGDVGGGGDLEVGDALRLVTVTRAGTATARELYHADLTLDDAVDAADLELALERLVDPAMPPRLHVRPIALPFVELDRAAGGEALALVANAGRAPFEDLDIDVATGVAVTAVGGLAGQTLALELDLPASARRGWRPGHLQVATAAQTAHVRLGHLVVLVAGQSNATAVAAPLQGWPEEASPSVRVLGNDYVWRDLLEPMDDATGQLDEPSRDDNVLYSMGTRLGFSLWEATGFEAYLVPSTRNGSPLSWWQPGADRFDRTSVFDGGLFGSSNFRAHVSAGLRDNPVGGQPHGSEGGPVTALVWYQGEADAASASSRSVFRSGTNAVMDAFVDELGAPAIYVQLASDWLEQTNVRHHAIAEIQRRMETTWGVLGQRRQGYHMVVAFDLPRSDSIHLSAFGQRVLAERVALAIREHVLGEDVDGTGPRLNRDQVSWSGTRVWLETTHVLDPGTLDEAYFTVFDGFPEGSLDDVDNYGGNAIEVLEAERDPADPTAVRLTLASPPTSTPWVRYMALPEVGASNGSPGVVPQPSWEQLAPGVVVAEAGKLPLPVFGPLAAVAR